jgi:hypothetical protein
MGEIKQTLVAGIGMNRGHQATFYTKFIEYHLGKRSQTVGCTGGI